jgi:hypothetical protein
MKNKEIIEVVSFISAMTGQSYDTIHSDLSIMDWIIGDGAIVYLPEEKEIQFVDNVGLDQKTQFAIIGFCSTKNITTDYYYTN